MPDGRHVWLAWMNNWQYANDIPTHPWRGAMTLPRELGLTRTPDGLRLTQQPIREIESLRGPAIAMRNIPLASSDGPIGLGVSETTFELEVTFRIGSSKRFGVVVREGTDERTVVGYDLRLREMFVDRRRSGRSDFHPDFAAVHAAPLYPDDDGTVTLRMIVDASAVEVFSGDGTAAITDRIFPAPTSDGVSLFAERGDVRVDRLRLWPLKSVWRD
jgi:fructan beta-fructosidase